MSYHYLKRLAHALTLLLVLWLMCPVWPTYAANGVTFGGAQEYRPFHFQDPQGQPAGFDVAVFQAIADGAGWQTRYRFGDWSAIQQQLATGAVDVVPMFISAARQERYHFSTPFLSTSHRLYGQQGQPALTSLSALDGQRVAAEHEGYGWRALQQPSVNAHVIPTDSEAAALRQVAEGKADYALVNRRIADYVTVSETLESIVALSPPVLPVYYAFAVNPQRPELVGIINQSLVRLRETGTLETLEKRWLQPPISWRDTLLQSLWFIIPLSALLVLAGCLLWRRQHQLKLANHTVQTAEQRRQLAEQKAEKLAVYDDLTGLPNTTFFRQYLEQAIDQARQNNTPIEVAMLTLLDLESIQQLAGYRITDILLKLEADSLALLHQGVIAYLGQGRFGFMFENIRDSEAALARAQELLVTAGQSYELDGTPIEPHVACGVALYPEHGADALQLYRAAELAMYTARDRRDACLLYHPAFEPDPRNLTLMRDLRQALKTGGITWQFQPKYNLAAQKVVGAEMLIRWQHPRYGWLPPDLFISLAEKTGIIKEVTQAAVREAITTVQQWGKDGKYWTLSVNVSGNDLADPAIVDDLIQRLDGHASRLTLEVTETAVMRDVTPISRHVARLREAGLKLSLDDYGTGYSSLSYLKQLNFDEIKIDMSFIKSMLDSDRDQKIVGASIHLAHDLDACVTAEGVEDNEIAARLLAMRCDTAQGYGIAKPMSLADYQHFASQ